MDRKDYNILSWRCTYRIKSANQVMPKSEVLRKQNHYLCNQCLSPQMLWVRIPFMAIQLDTKLCDKVCQGLVTGRWFSPGTPVSSTNKTDRHDITNILFKVTLNTANLTLTRKQNQPTFTLYWKQCYHWINPFINNTKYILLQKSYRIFMRTKSIIFYQEATFTVNVY